MNDRANEENILGERAREAIRSGKLPARRPDRTLGGPGSQVHCAVCGELILRNQLELEFSVTVSTPVWIATTYTRDAVPPGKRHSVAPTPG